MIRVRHCLFFLFLSLSSPFPFLFPFPSFTLPFPFPFPRSCEFFDQGAKPALGKTIIGKKTMTCGKTIWKGSGFLQRVGLVEARACLWGCMIKSPVFYSTWFLFCWSLEEQNEWTFWRHNSRVYIYIYIYISISWQLILHTKAYKINNMLVHQHQISFKTSL